jgi:3-deoxy-D-manno-octulosonic-acid transferase
VTPLPLAAYRGVATLAGGAAPLLRRLGPPGSAWRSAFTGATADLAEASGSVWVHAASLGEMVAARTWIGALLDAGQRPPILLTARTERGLARARADLGDRVVARVAPLDIPQLLRSFLRAAAPWRLDVIETELWPHLILESRRRGVAVVFVSATVSERTRARLLRWGLAGRGVFGEGVWVLAQSERHAERFRSLGVPSGRVAVTGDLKAERPAAGASRDVAERPAVVFGSLRPGEEGIAAALARGLAREGSRALVVAPRHREGLTRVLAALAREGIPVSMRREEDRGTAMRDWIAGLSDGGAGAGGPRVGILATQGELPTAYQSAALAVVGGTFAPYGGHNALEPAARGCAIVIGPHADAIEESVEALACEGAVLRVTDAAEALPAVLSLVRNPDAVRRMGEGSARAAASASDSARRSLEALERFGLTP